MNRAICNGLPNRMNQRRQRHAAFLRARRGQAMIESLLVLIVLVAGFCFFFDFAYGAVSRLLLNHAAARAARADTVGFNHFQQLKNARVALIPVSGKGTVPAGRKLSASSELALIRTYLQSEGEAEASGILNYERWERLTCQSQRKGHETAVKLSMELPALLPWKLGALLGVSGAETLTLQTEWRMEHHAKLYLKEALE
ncbi:MAG: hypothetical protein RR268_01810 [Kiritimatiellia bacterium]